MWNVIKKRAGYIKSTDPASAKAADRLDRLKAATSSGPADETGPFENKTGRNKITGGSIFGAILPHSAAGFEGQEPPTLMKGPSPPKPDIELPPIQPGLDPGELADHHQKLADYFDKVAHPGSQTTPATTQLSPDEKRELGPETDMQQ